MIQYSVMRSVKIIRKEWGAGRKLAKWSKSPRYNDIHCPGSAFDVRHDAQVFRSEWVERLKEGGIPEPELSVRFIVEHVWHVTAGNNAASRHHPEFSSQQHSLASELMHLRMKRMPVQYILGEWDFRNLTLALRPPVLIPRPETEELVGLVLQHCCPGYKVSHDTRRSGAEGEEREEEKVVRFLDIGCGSGAISLALLQECPQMVGYAVDVSEEAVELTRENAEKNSLSHRLTVCHSSIEDLYPSSCTSQLPAASEWQGGVDVIVSNPPYISTQDMATLDPSISWYEDRRALHGGVDGMEVTTKILEMCRHFLRRGGQLWLELGLHQDASQLLLSHPHWHLSLSSTHRDHTDRTRFHQLWRL